MTNANLTLNVRNVDQANWNEVLMDDRIELVYDLGAPLNASKNDVQTIFDARRRFLERDKPILIISHWDIDHIHCLRYMNLQAMQDCFRKFICVDAMKSLTSQKIYNNVCVALGAGNVYCVRPACRGDGISMHLWKRVGNISIYAGEKSSNINYCGLSMFVKGMHSSVLFSGDIRLIQAKNIYDQELQHNLRTNNHILIAPHHGGDNTAKHRKYSAPTTEVIISVGSNNNYGHPNELMLTYLRMLCYNIYRTDVDGDIAIPL